ncbi:MAG: Uma2 family endonuclease [Cyanobacteria bacterium CAN_BIN43]|nr:Uma2 family endonuclease [Cyanobacteria bacterium CAN_BIN43]
MTSAKVSLPPGTIVLPYDLESDEPELESDLHRDQIDILLKCLKAWWKDRDDFYATGNLTIYYSPDQVTTRDFRGPDFFVVLGAENRPRKSWMLWAEQGKYPNVIVELLSDSTAAVDRGLKKQLYQDTFRTPEYFWFHPHTLEFKGFYLSRGEYQPIEPNQQNWLWSKELGLYLGVLESELRFFAPDGQLVPTPGEQAVLAQKQTVLAQEQTVLAQEQAAIAQERFEQAQQQLEQERQSRETLLAKLREKGLDPDQF